MWKSSGITKNLTDMTGTASALGQGDVQHGVHMFLD